MFDESKLSARDKLNIRTDNAYTITPGKPFPTTGYGSLISAFQLMKVPYTHVKPLMLTLADESQSVFVIIMESLVALGYQFNEGCQLLHLVDEIKSKRNSIDTTPQEQQYYVQDKVPATVLSFRAEMVEDIERAMPYFNKYLTGIKIHIIDSGLLPEVSAEMTFDNTTMWYDALYEINEEVIDSHVLVESALPLNILDNVTKRHWGKYESLPTQH